MLIFDPSDALQIARMRAHRLQAEAEAERLRHGPGARDALAMLLRRAADRIDPAPLRRPAGQC